VTSKRFFSLLAVSAFLAAPLAAQKPAPRFGALVGVNIAKVTGDATTGLDQNRTGFLAGVFGEFNLSNSVAIEPELLYTQKGGAGSEQGVDVTFKLDYIQIPVLFKYKFGAADARVRPSLYLGPAVGFKTSCKFAAEGGGVGFDFDCDEFSDIGSIKGTDFGGVIGAGVDVRNFLVGARYEMGFTNVAESIEAGSEDVKNSTISFYVGYAFRLK
jgi:hypothetical protein